MSKTKLIEELSDFVSTFLKEKVKNKEGIFNKIDPQSVMILFGVYFNLQSFKNYTEDFTKGQWQQLIKLSNSKIIENAKIEKKEQAALEKLTKMIDAENYSIIEITMWNEKHFVVKVRFSNNDHYVEGSIKEIATQILKLVQNM